MHTVIPGRNCFKMQNNKVKLILDLTTFIRRGSFPGQGEGRGGYLADAHWWAVMIGELAGKNS